MTALASAYGHPAHLPANPASIGAIFVTSAL
jgi:hypothetical protein